MSKWNWSEMNNLNQSDSSSLEAKGQSAINANMPDTNESQAEDAAEGETE